MMKAEKGGAEFKTSMVVFHRLGIATVIVPHFVRKLPRNDGTYSFYALLSYPVPLNQNQQLHTSSPKFEQYYVQGEQLYLKNCSNCHQKTGTGLGLFTHR